MVKKCRICGKSFSTKIALKKHLKENHRKYYYGIKLVPVIVLIILLVTTLVTLSPTATITSTVTPATTSSVASTRTTQIQSLQEPPALDFELPEIDELGLTGKIIRLSQFTDKPIFLEFMSPICPHCLRMAPVVKELKEKYGDRIIFISIVYPSGGVDYASKVLAKKGLDWIHVVDEKGIVFDAYSITGTPTYIILDKNHVEVERIVGEKPRDVLEEAILSVLSGTVD